MPTVVGIRLRFSKTLWFDPAGSTPAEGDTVIVETERGTESGLVTQPPHEVDQSALPAPLKPVVRVADERDVERLAELEEREREALPIFRQLVVEHKLDMKPVDVEYLLDGDKAVFYFSAEERVDFRELVRELASRFHVRIEMRQVGVRDEARMVGGVGHCGQMLCCVRFGGEFQPVSIRMAKEQDLPLNPLKISGLCGRLMCCLRYEFEAYKDYKSRAPKRGAMVETPTGQAKVTELNTPRETVTMRLEDGTTVTIPLSAMECGKGGSCPCSVSREALAEAQGPGALPALVVPDLQVSADRPAEGSDESGGRRRRRRSKPAERSDAGSQRAEKGEQAPRSGRRSGGESAGGRQKRSTGDKRTASDKQAARETQAAAGETQAAADKQAGDGQQAKSSRSGRRRRRRKPSGGDGNKAE